MSDSRFAPCGSDAASVPRSDWGDGQFGALDDSGAAVLRLGFDPQVVAARKDQKAAVSASMLDRDGHQGLDQPVEQEFARHRLRHADYGREVEVLERGFNGREVRLGDLWRDLGMA